MHGALEHHAQPGDAFYHGFSCGNKTGIDDRHLRLAVRGPGEVGRLTAGLADFLAGKEKGKGKRGQVSIDIPMSIET